VCGLDYTLISIKFKGDFVNLTLGITSKLKVLSVKLPERWLKQMLFLQILRVNFDKV
jgi:hypothetical protein